MFKLLPFETKTYHSTLTCEEITGKLQEVLRFTQSRSFWEITTGQDLYVGGMKEKTFSIVRKKASFKYSGILVEGIITESSPGCSLKVKIRYDTIMIVWNLFILFLISFSLFLFSALSWFSIAFLLVYYATWILSYNYESGIATDFLERLIKGKIRVQ